MTPCHIPDIYVVCTYMLDTIDCFCPNRTVEMRTLSVTLLLVVASVASAVPFGIYPGGGSAYGQAGSNLVTGSSYGPYQGSQITSLSSHAQVR